MAQNTDDSPVPAESIHLLPADVRSLIKTIRLIQTNGVDKKGRPAVWYSRPGIYIQHPALSWFRYSPRVDFDKSARVREHFIKAFAKFARVPDDRITAIRERRKSQETTLREVGYHVQDLRAEVQWRLVAGIGNSHPFENSLSLDRLFGFPYICASSWKGMLRGYVIDRIAALQQGGEDHRDEEEHTTLLGALDEALASGKIGAAANRLRASCTESADLLETAARVFGSVDAAGEVCFFDALPMNRPRFEADVMTPHVNPSALDVQALLESAGEARRSEHSTPNPIVFLTVGRGTRFGFAWYGRDQALVDAVGTWLREAVQDVGIGAKTAAGYGYMSPLSDPQAPAR